MDLVRKTSDQEWSVQSADQNTIVLENPSCPTNCHLLCNECAICIHKYSCTCVDYLIKHTICKHIHLVESSKTGKVFRTVTSDGAKFSGMLIADTSHQLPKENKIVSIKDSIHQLLSRIHILSEKCSSLTELKMAEKHLITTEQILQMAKLNSTTFCTQTITSHNARVQAQRFHSTNRKRKRCTTLRLTKPTIQEKRALVGCLIEDKPLYKRTTNSIVKSEGICLYYCQSYML